MKKTLYFASLALGCAAFGGLLLSGTAVAKSASTVGFMHPFGVQSAEIVKPAGQAIDARYGVLSFNPSYTLRPQSDLKDQKSPVYAVNAGRIVSVQADTNGQAVVTIIHDGGFTSRYAQLSDSPLIGFTSDQINKGDVIGFIAPSQTLEYSLMDKDGFPRIHNLKTGELNNQNYQVTEKTNLAIQAFFSPCFPNCDDQPTTGNGRTRPSNLTTPINPVQPSTPSSTTGSGATSGGASGTNTGTSGGSSSGTDNTVYTVGSSRNVSAAEYQAYAGLTGNETAAYTAAGTVTCPTPIREAHAEMADAALANEDALITGMIQEPAPMEDLSCFDNFATTMSTVVADIGLSGSFDVFGLNVDIGQLAQQGADAVQQNSCDRANTHLGQVRDAGINSNALYSGQTPINRSGPKMQIFTPPTVGTPGIAPTY